MRKPHPKPELTPRQEAGFRARFDEGAPDACWEWRGARSDKGYGCFGVGKANYRAHRLAFMLATGIDPGALMVCHRCDNRACVNPAHLWVGTAGDNARDCVAKGRHAGAGRPRNHQGGLNPRAKLTEDQVREIRSSPLSESKLARRYGVGRSTIWGARSGRRWRHVQPAADLSPAGKQLANLRRAWSEACPAVQQHFLTEISERAAA